MPVAPRFRSLAGLFLLALGGCTRDASTPEGGTERSAGLAQEAGGPPRADRTLEADPLAAWKQKLSSPDTDVRLDAVKALGDLARGSEAATAIDLLIGALRDRQALVVRQARQILTLVGQPAVEPLGKTLGTDSPELRAQVASTLGDLGPRAASTAPALLVHLADPDLRVRESVAWALEKIGEPVVVPLAQELSCDDPARRIQAARILRNLGPQAHSAVPALIEALKDEDPDIHVAVASALYVVDPEAARSAGVQ